jgi:hypothetical protein
MSHHVGCCKTEESGCGCHTNDAMQLPGWHSRQLREILDRQVHVERDARQNLELRKPMEA